METLNICYFDNNMGEYDEFNPRFVFEQRHTKAIVTELSYHPRYYYDHQKLMKKMNIEKDDYDVAIKLLENISAVAEDDLGRLRLNFAFFTAKDIKRIQKIMRFVIKSNKFVIRQNTERLYMLATHYYPKIDPKQTLYHLLCGKIFDGEFFNYLYRSNLLKTNYPKNGNRDYMIIGYQNDKVCNDFNESLLCSTNNARYENTSLTSFGTPNERLDYFRYFRLCEMNKINEDFYDMHNLLIGYTDDQIVKDSIEIIKKLKNKQEVEESNLLKALKVTDYVSDENKVIVPVFENSSNAIKKLNLEIIKIFGDYIKFYLNLVKERVIREKISCVQHGVSVDELTNELWHIFFGLLNKYFVDKGIVAQPERKRGQGEYLKCVFID